MSDSEGFFDVETSIQERFAAADEMAARLKEESLRKPSNSISPETDFARDARLAERATAVCGRRFQPFLRPSIQELACN